MLASQGLLQELDLENNVLIEVIGDNLPIARTSKANAFEVEKGMHDLFY